MTIDLNEIMIELIYPEEEMGGQHCGQKDFTVEEGHPVVGINIGKEGSTNLEDWVFPGVKD